MALLRVPRQRELAMLDAVRQSARHLGHGILAVGLDEVGKGCEQRGVGEHLGLDAVMQRLLPRIEDVSQSFLALSLVVRGLSYTLDRLQRGISPVLRDPCL